MKYLLDTHALLWYLTDDVNLSETAHSIIDTAECYFSKVSLWEIAIKQSLGKLQYKHSIPDILDLCRQENFLNIPVTENHIERLLIAQAQCENLTLITRDTIIPKYDVKTVW